MFLSFTTLVIMVIVTFVAGMITPFVLICHLVLRADIR